MQMIQVAFQKALESGGPEALAVADRILEQMAKQRDYEDKQAFQAALRRIQDQLKPIAKRGTNNETHSKYALASDVDAAIDGLLKTERMTLTFEPRPSDKPEMVLVIGILSLGAYSREYPLELPADGKGAKGGGVMSRTHATGSAITYGKRYLKNMIFDLSFKEKDDDGNQAGATGMSDESFIQHRDNIEGANSIADVTRFYISALKAAGEAGDRKAPGEFEAAANKRKKELTAK